MIYGNVHSIESMGTVDGPGVRFVVFLQGCPLRCKYCHNPDTWTTDSNKLMSVDEIYKQFESKKEFYRTGGITVTGGEPLLQMEFLIDLFRKFKENDIHTCLDTSGVCFNSANTVLLDELLDVTDLVLLDIKHIDSDEHKKLTSVNNENIIEFARYLDKNGISVIIRHVIVPNITYVSEYLYNLGKFIGSLSNVIGIDVLPYHTMGIVKYENLNISYPLEGVPALGKTEAVMAKKLILKGVNDIRKNNQ